MLLATSALQLVQSVVLVGGTVHSMVPGEEPRPQQVLVHEGRIVALANPGTTLPTLTNAEGEVVEPEPIDISGKHVVPGLIDGLVNHDADHDALYVASGVTLVRDQANDLARVLSARTAEVRDAALGPDLFICGRILDGDPPVTTAAVVIASVAEAEEKIPRYLEFGVDYLSFYQGFGTSRQGSEQTGDRSEILAKTCELAHEGGLQVWGPRLPGMAIAEAVRSGQDGLFYLDGVLPEGAHWNSVDPAGLKPIIDGVPRSLAITPAMRLYSHRIEDPGDDPPELAVLGPHYSFQWVQERDMRRNLGWEDYVANGARVVALQRELLGKLSEAGQPLVPGSGAPNAWVLPGVGLHDELADWQRAGIPNEKILHAVTAGAAQALGVADQRGTIEAGKIADLIVVGGDPRESLDFLRAPDEVVLRGKLLRRQDLDKMVMALFERVAKVKAEAAKPIEIPELALPEGEVLLSGIVENKAHGQRLSAERYAVVRAEDQSLNYIGRLVTPASATYAETTLETSQKFVENKLQEFVLEILFSERDSFKLSGQRVGGNMRMRMSGTRDGQTVSENTSVAQEISFLDVGSVTSHLVLAKHQPPGRFFTLFLEDLNPIIGTWAMQAGEDFQYLVQTAQGGANVKLDSRGVPVAIRRVQGTTIVETTTLESQPEIGPGLALPERMPQKGVQEASDSKPR